MAIRNIVQWPSKGLQAPSTHVGDGKDEVELTALVEDLIDTCKAVGGLGLAAPQIGVPLRVCVLNMDHFVTPADQVDEVEMPGYETLINPRIIESEGEQRLVEGCLSVPREQSRVTRAAFVTVEYAGLDGETHSIAGQSLLAVALQHELDHLEGTVYVDHLPRFKRTIVRNKMVKLRKRLRKAGFDNLPVPGAVAADTTVETYDG